MEFTKKCLSIFAVCLLVLSISLPVLADDDVLFTNGDVQLGTTQGFNTYSTLSSPWVKVTNEQVQNGALAIAVHDMWTCPVVDVCDDTDCHQVYEQCNQIFVESDYTYDQDVTATVTGWLKTNCGAGKAHVILQQIEHPWEVLSDPIEIEINANEWTKFSVSGIIPTNMPVKVTINILEVTQPNDPEAPVIFLDNVRTKALGQDGRCGLAADKIHTDWPVPSELCTIGVASEVLLIDNPNDNSNNVHPYALSWSCSGVQGGLTERCIAPIQKSEKYAIVVDFEKVKENDNTVCKKFIVKSTDGAGLKFKAKVCLDGGLNDNHKIKSIALNIPPGDYKLVIKNRKKVSYHTELDNTTNWSQNRRKHKIFFTLGDQIFEKQTVYVRY